MGTFLADSIEENSVFLDASLNMHRRRFLQFLSRCHGDINDFTAVPAYKVVMRGGNIIKMICSVYAGKFLNLSQLYKKV